MTMAPSGHQRAGSSPCSLPPTLLACLLASLFLSPPFQTLLSWALTVAAAAAPKCWIFCQSNSATDQEPCGISAFLAPSLEVASAEKRVREPWGETARKTQWKVSAKRRWCFRGVEMHPELLKISWGVLVLFCLLQEEAVGSARERKEAGIVHSFGGTSPRAMRACKVWTGKRECPAVWPIDCLSVCVGGSRQCEGILELSAWKGDDCDGKHMCECT